MAFTIAYHTKEEFFPVLIDLNVPTPDMPAMAPYVVLQIGDVTIFPSIEQVEQIRDALAGFDFATAKTLIAEGQAKLSALISQEMPF